jgi:hypothetical protein
MSIGRIFSAVKNTITACCVNCTSSQPSIVTGTILALWITVGSRLHLVDGRYHVTAWNRFYPVFIALMKNVTEEAKYFKPVLVHNFNQNL